MSMDAGRHRERPSKRARSLLLTLAVAAGTALLAGQAPASAAQAGGTAGAAGVAAPSAEGLEIEASRAKSLESPEAPQGAPVVVRLAERALVTGPQVLLGEVARIEGGDPEMVARLQRLPVGQAALPGASRRLTPADVAVRLRQARIDLTGLRLEAPSGSVEVATASAFLDPQAVLQEVRRYVEQRTPAGYEAAVTLEEALPPVPIPDRSVQVRVAMAGPIGPGEREVPLTLELRSGDGERLYRLLWIRVLVKVSELGLSGLGGTGGAAAATAGGRTLAGEGAVPESGRTVAAGEEAVPAGGGTAAAGQGTLPALPASRETAPSDEGIAPQSPGDAAAGEESSAVVVRKGGTVRVVVTIGSVTVWSEGIALEEGRPGQVIPVVNPSSGRSVRAQVIDRQTVRAVTSP